MLFKLGAHRWVNLFHVTTITIIDAPWEEEPFRRHLSVGILHGGEEVYEPDLKEAGYESIEAAAAAISAALDRLARKFNA
jgi:hypothetical protein